MTTAALDELRSRLRDFLLFLRPKMLQLKLDGARETQFRRVSDIRISQLAVKKPNMDARDVSHLLSSDPNKPRLEAMAVAEKVIRPEHATLPLVKGTEELGYYSELCILTDLLSPQHMQVFMRAFAQSKPLGTAEPAPAEAPPPAAPSEAPIPEKVLQLLGNVKDLWSIPVTTQKLMQMLTVPDTKVEAIASEVERDPGLSAQVLRVVNSAFYGMAGKIASIKRAVIMLGFQTTKRIVTLASLISKLGKEHGDLKFDLKAFWGHSLWVAYAAQNIAKATKMGGPDEHFTAGLLHDIGKLVEYQYLRHAMREILSGVAGGGRYEEVEMRVLEVNHAVIGAAVCGSWGFPPAVVQSVRHHLDPIESLEETPLPREALVVSAVCSISKRTMEAEETERWCSLLNITPDQLSAARAEATQTSLASLRDVFMYS